MENINLALYSYGWNNTLSMEEKLKKAAEMGYAGVEYAGGYGGVDAAEMQRLLAKYNLKALSSHVGMDAIARDLPFLKEVGAQFAIVPGFPFSTHEEAKECARLLNENGQLAAPYGIKVGYHNHTSEFFVVDGKPLLDTVIENTDPALVGIELDCGWASAAGIDPAAYIAKYAGRFIAIHVKENSKVTGPDKPHSPKDEQPQWKIGPDGKPIIPEEVMRHFEELMKMNVPTGQGIVDWKAVKAAAEAQGCHAFIVEREYSYDGKERVDCLQEDVNWLKANL